MVRALGAGLLIASAMTTTTSAVETRFWRVDAAHDHEDAEAEGVAIDGEGAMTLSLAHETRIESDELYFWELARGHGHTYVGTGDSGHVLRVDGDELELLADLEVLEVMALVVDDDVVYAGGAADGTVYAIGPDETVTPYYDTGAGVVWDLALHPDGDLLVATGETGQVVRVSGKDKGKVIYESTDAHVMCITVQSASSILVGTAGDGLVCRLDGEGGVEVLYDAAEEEVRAIVTGPEGEVYIAVNVAPKGEGGGGGGLDDGPRPAVYALGAHGSARRLWTASSQFLFALDRGVDGDLIAGTGDPASVVRIDPHRHEATTLLEIDEGNVLVIDASRDAIDVATGDPARLFTLGPRLERSGTLASEVRDAGAEASWSRIRWVGDHPSGTDVSFETRTGNRGTPDRTWSPWVTAENEGANGHRVNSPPARFLQWRATLEGSGSTTPRITEVVTSYREVNLPPMVRALDVSRKGASLFTDGDKRARAVSQRLPGGVEVDYSLPFDGAGTNQPLAPGSVAWATGLRTASWVAIDPNGDELVFDLYYRPVESRRWLLLAEEVSDLAYTWDASVFPDGSYHLKLVARDAPSNPDGDEHEDVLVSEVFEIDNTPPRVSALEARLDGDGRIAIEARASDGRSPIIRADYTLDGQVWLPARTATGLLDAQEVSFQFTVDAGDREKGDPVVLRVVDEAGNPVVSRAFIE
jgi:hypothetical protein